MASSEAFDAPKAIISFDFNALSPAVIGVVNEAAKTVALTVPFGTNVTALVPTIAHTGASVNPAGGVANNFTTAQTYTVTAADASTQAYVVTVTVALPADAVFNTSGNLAAGTYNNITINNPAVVTVTGAVVVNGCVTVNGGTLLMGGSTFIGPGCFSLNSGATLGIGSPAGITSGAAGNVQTGTRTFSPGATYVYNGGVSQFAGNALPSPVANLTIANTGSLGTDKVTGNAGQAVTGLLRVQQGTYASSSDYADVQIDPAGTLSLAAPITVSGNWTNNGTLISNGFGVTLDGTAAQSIGGVSVTGFSNLTDSNTNAAVTFNSNFNVSGTFNMNGAGTVFTPGSPTVQINSAGNVGTISGNGRVHVTRLSSNPFSSQYRFFTFNVTALTVEWSGAGDQSIENGVAGYGGITVSGGGTKTIGGSGTLSISGDVTTTPTTNLAQGFNTLNIGGNWNNGGGFIPGTAPVGVRFNGSGDQTITTGGTGVGKTFGLLTIAKSGGTATLAGPLRSSVLTVSSGTFDTSSASSYAVTVTSDVSITGGTFIANSSAVTVGGNWGNTGTFTAGGSTVTFNGSTGQTISGNTSFYNLTKSITTPAQTLFFAAGSTIAAANSLTFTGTSGNLLSLRSTSNGTQWNLAAPAIHFVNFVDVRDSNASGGNLVIQTDSVNSGNNVNWAFALPVLSVSDVTQAEGNAGTGTFTFTVSLSAPSGGVTFDIATADGTAQDDDPATEDNDYVARSLTGQTITAGDTSYTFDVTVNGDTFVEPNENFFVNVTNVTGATVGDGQATGTITNDDCTEAPSGMVGWWKANGNPFDSIRGNNGSMVNGATFAPGMVDQAFSLNQATQQYVSLSDLGADSLLNNSNGSISAWVKPSTVSEFDIVAAFGAGGPGQPVGLGINGNVRVYHQGDPYDWQTTVPVSANIWTLLTYTWDTTNEKVYKNGLLADTRVRNFTYAPGSSRIGYGFFNDPSAFYTGLIDELSIYNRTLDPSEVLAQYNAGSAGVCSTCTPAPVGLVSWWTGDGNGLDSRSVNNGTLQNGPTYSSGKVGQAFDLNGINQYVQKTAPVGLPVGNQPRTMELWLRTPVNLTSATDSGIFQYGSALSGNMFGLITSSNAPGKLYFYGHSADLAGTRSAALPTVAGPKANVGH